MAFFFRFALFSFFVRRTSFFFFICLSQRSPSLLVSADSLAQSPFGGGGGLAINSTRLDAQDSIPVF